MKQFIVAALISLVCFSCQDEFPEPMVMGSLQLESVEIAEAANETISRAIDSDLIVEIWQNGEIFQYQGQVFRFTAGHLPSNIMLPAGNYVVKAFTKSHQEAPEWTNGDLGSAIYYKEENVEIIEDKVALISMKVPMTNIGVTFTLPEGFNQSFSEYTFTVAEGGVQSDLRTVSVKKAETIYLKPGAFTVTLQAKNVDNESVSTTLTRKEVTPGTIYTVAYQIAASSRTSVLYEGCLQ